MNLPLLSVARKWSGHWWLPAAPDLQIPGVLSYEPAGGLRLELIGGWEYRQTTQNPDGSVIVHAGMLDWGVIHGEAQDKQFTLVDNRVAGATTYGIKSLFMGRPDQLNISVGTALVGCHLENVDAAEFVGGSATIENLTAWSRLTALEIRHDLNDDGTQLAGSGEIRYQRADPLIAHIGGVTATLDLLLTLPDFKKTRESSSGRIVERSSIEFRSESPRRMADWLDMLSGVRDLVSLSSLSAAADITLHLYAPAVPERYPEGHPLAHQRRRIDVYERRVLMPDPEREGADHSDFVLTLDDIDFADLIPKWMEVKERFSAARGMILGLRYVTEGFLETRVVTAVGAAESLHRSLGLDPPIPTTEFRQLKKAVKEAVPLERRGWVSDLFARNEPALKERLIDLAMRPGEFMKGLVPDPSAWATAAAKARNALAHVGQTESQSFDELHAVVEVTAAVVILNLLSELGVTQERLARAILEHPEFAAAARLSKNYFLPAVSNPSETLDP